MFTETSFFQILPRKFDRLRGEVAFSKRFSL